MSEKFRPPGAITRRDLVKRAAGLATVGAGSLLASRDAAAAAASPASDPRAGRATSQRHRVAIIGAGAGGVAAAYFLADTHDVDLFEARSKIGGHCDSHVIAYRGRRVTVDIGAQFFHPDTHPIYVNLLQELGLYDPAHPAADDTLEAPASLCIFPTGGGAPIFSSSHALSTPQHALEFARFTALARQAVLSGLPWETTVAAWVSSLSLSQSFTFDVLASGEPAAVARSQSHGPVAPHGARAGAQTNARRLVFGDGERPPRALPVDGAQRARTHRAPASTPTARPR